jgi:hypothetical protein
LENAKAQNTEEKIQDLGIDQMITVYEATVDSEIKLDSLVIFKKSGYLILYDFARNRRNPELIQKHASLEDFELIDDRLYLGKQ